MTAIALPRFDSKPLWGLLGGLMAMVMVMLAGSGGVQEAEDPPAESFWDCEDTHVAASASAANVTTAVNAADDGDCVTVPSGTASWSSPIDLPVDIQVIGATTVSCTAGMTPTCTATDNTVLTCSPVCFQYDLAMTQRVSGFTMTIDDSFDGFSGESTGTDFFRLDHNHIIGTDSFTQMWIRGGGNAVHPQGVVDNNLVEDGAFRPIGSDWQLDDSLPNADTQNELWAQIHSPGDGDGLVYIEHNHFKHDANGIQSSDSNYGGSYVFRFNHVDSGFHNSEVHGSQGENRGSRWTEIYKNDITTTSGCQGGTTNFRGGTGFIWGNVQAVECSYGVEFTIDRAEYDEGAGNFGTFKECGTGGADGNSPAGVDQQTGGANGWRCRDQVGTYYDSVKWQSNPPSGSFTAWAQVQRPVYVFLNLTDASPMSIAVAAIGDVEDKIVVSREFYCDDGFTASCGSGVRTGAIASLPSTCTTGMGYWATDEGEWDDTNGATADGRFYRCTSTDTWELDYTPHDYPHPWTN